MQDLTSIVDQVRECREAIMRMGWVVIEEYICSDEAKPGDTTLNRTGLQTLREHAALKTGRKFDCIVSEETSRFGRNLTETLVITDELKYDGCALYFVKEELGSWHPQFRSQFIECQKQDEKSVQQHGQRVKRGQRGQVERGFVGSGRTYGYFNVPVEVPGTRTLYGRPKVEGVKMEHNPEEVAIVVRIFESVAAGMSQLKLVLALNREGVPSSLAKTSTKPKPRTWNVGAITRILNNKKYIGIYEHNKRQQIKNPRTKRKEMIPRPEEEWQVDLRPELRIISDELWNSAHEKMRDATPRFSKQRNGGLNRTSASRNYIFSGLLICGVCGGSVNVNSGAPPNKLYGCQAARFRGTCTNKRTIGVHRLQEDLLSYIAENLKAPELTNRIRKQFESQLAQAIANEAKTAQKREDSPEEIDRKRSDLNRQIRNILDTCQLMGPSPELKHRHDELKSQLAALQAPVKKTVLKTYSAEQITAFLDQKLADLGLVLAGDPEVAKKEMQKRITKLVLTPKEADGEEWYEISGDLSLFAREEDVMLGQYMNKVNEHNNMLALPISLILSRKPFRLPRTTAA